MVFHTAPVRELQRRGAPSQPSRKVLQDLALEKPVCCFVVAQGGEVKPHLQLLFFCALVGRGGTTSGFLMIISCRWFSPRKKRELQPFVSAAWKDAGD